ncbi:hypothetical protein ACWFR1_23290 [Streptomyces sp. NPDC055103]
MKAPCNAITVTAKTWPNDDHRQSCAHAAVPGMSATAELESWITFHTDLSDSHRQGRADAGSRGEEYALAQEVQNQDSAAGMASPMVETLEQQNAGTSPFWL